MSTSKAVRPSKSSTPLVGRTAEWARLLTTWQRASAGHPQLLVLCGEADIGKTRLAEALLSEVRRQGSATAVARCYAVEGALAYTPVMSWLRAEALRPGLAGLETVWLSEVARLLPTLLLERPGLPPTSPLQEDWQRQRLFEALAHAFLGTHGPLLLLLDDVQWCDRETVAWLHYLLRGILAQSLNKFELEKAQNSPIRTRFFVRIGEFILQTFHWKVRRRKLQACQPVYQVAKGDLATIIWKHESRFSIKKPYTSSTFLRKLVNFP